MGRVGLRTVLHLRVSVLFCAALATANIPASFAQAHPPKITAPGPEAELNSTTDLPAPTISAPDETSVSEETPALSPDSASARTLADATRLSDTTDDFAASDGLALAGARGVTHPVCLRCPPAQYSYPALLHKVQGNVTLDATVGADGWVTRVRILGSLGFGLDDQAMKAVRTWQWEPARDAEGKTVAAHQTVVIAFHIPK